MSASNSRKGYNSVRALPPEATGVEMQATGVAEAVDNASFLGSSTFRRSTATASESVTRPATAVVEWGVAPPASTSSTAAPATTIPSSRHPVHTGPAFPRSSLSPPSVTSPLLPNSHGAGGVTPTVGSLGGRDSTALAVHAHTAHAAGIDPNGVPKEEQEGRPSDAPPAARPPIPWFCVLTIVACCAGFSASLYETAGVIAPLNINPLIGPSTEALITTGAKVACLIQPPHNQWWRIVVPIWLHAGLIHIAVNMNMLYQAGFQLERAAGPWRFGFLYLFAGFLSIISSSVFAPARVTVGASGALFGIIGAYLGELIQNCHLLTRREATIAFLSLGFTILLNLAIGLLPLLDNFAHVGGLLGGLALGFAVLVRVDEWGQVKLRQLICAALGVMAYLFMAIGGILLLWYRDPGSSICSWCQYISCVPSPWWSCDLSTAWQAGVCDAT